MLSKDFFIYLFFLFIYLCTTCNTTWIFPSGHLSIFYIIVMFFPRSNQDIHSQLILILEYLMGNMYPHVQSILPGRDCQPHHEEHWRPDPGRGRQRRPAHRRSFLLGGRRGSGIALITNFVCLMKF